MVPGCSGTCEAPTRSVARLYVWSALLPVIAVSSRTSIKSAWRSLPWTAARHRSRRLIRRLLCIHWNVTTMRPRSSTTAVRVHDLVVAFGDHIVLDHLSLEVQRGEILGFVGGSGSGKSVLLRSIIGLVPKRQGAIEVLGID